MTRDDILIMSAELVGLGRGERRQGKGGGGKEEGDKEEGDKEEIEKGEEEKEEGDREKGDNRPPGGKREMWRREGVTDVSAIGR